ncbi:hypothetical protein BDB00DRAFT_773134 [Zychaea mexicana]|uniref:uncharacterized protein n=1 Tax=Zychaea mexicana TaxID=64656 RepID=UPI0022FE7D2A|nr:uncharacterized protein BDB00DRAFT_773134 [Zychaea mexicana]KAI9488137.1 hypothetical protein BDB00DRAFT_773134 [Zychaea mexicana]
MEKPDQDTLTHPLLYRENINSAQQSEGNSNNTVASSWMPPAQPLKDGGDECWDCYPHLVRKIENEGTPEQVEHLHQLQQSQSPKH